MINILKNLNKSGYFTALESPYGDPAWRVSISLTDDNLPDFAAPDEDFISGFGKAPTPEDALKVACDNCNIDITRYDT